MDPKAIISIKNFVRKYTHDFMYKHTFLKKYYSIVQIAKNGQHRVFEIHESL